MNPYKPNAHEYEVLVFLIRLAILILETIVLR
jgi:hypothetical protein